MIYYVDASAWVKYYLSEQGSNWMTAFFGNHPRCAAHELAPVEVAATILRRHQMQQVEARLSQETINEVNRHFRGFLAIPWGALSTESVQEVLFRHRLRGADGIHFAAALWLQTQSRDEQVTLVASDAELLKAAMAQGMATIDPMTA